MILRLKTTLIPTRQTADAEDMSAVIPTAAVRETFQEAGTAAAEAMATVTVIIMTGQLMLKALQILKTTEMRTLTAVQRMTATEETVTVQETEVREAASEEAAQGAATAADAEATVQGTAGREAVMVPAEAQEADTVQETADTEDSAMTGAELPAEKILRRTL